MLAENYFVWYLCAKNVHILIFQNVLIIIWKKTQIHMVSFITFALPKALYDEILLKSSLRKEHSNS